MGQGALRHAVDWVVPIGLDPQTTTETVRAYCQANDMLCIPVHELEQRDERIAQLTVERDDFHAKLQQAYENIRLQQVEIGRFASVGDAMRAIALRDARIAQLGNALTAARTELVRRMAIPLNALRHTR